MSLEAFVENILTPEILVIHNMQKLNCSYKAASSNVYAGDVPTVYSENKLLHVSGVLNLYSRRATYLHNFKMFYYFLTAIRFYY